MLKVPDKPPNDKVKAIEHIYYEAKMLYCVFFEYWEPGFSASKEWLHNFVIEATLLHTRSMIDFFRESKEQTRKDDIVALDYEFQSAPFPFASELSKRISKRIVHLTYYRTGVIDQDRNWKFKFFIPIILDRCREFFIHLLNGGWELPPWPGEARIRAFIENLESIKTCEVS